MAHDVDHGDGWFARTHYSPFQFEGNYSVVLEDSV